MYHYDFISLTLFCKKRNARIFVQYFSARVNVIRDILDTKEILNTKTLKKNSKCISMKKATLNFKTNSKNIAYFVFNWNYIILMDI